MKTYKGVEV